MENALRALEELLTAASVRIGPEYFQLPVADADAVYRERVYCYELYHQLRCLWEDFPFSLGGEIDKGGHPHFRGGPYANAKPDFLIHVPGSMAGNLACVEIKPFLRPVAEFASDLRKLTWFCHHANYHRGLFLVYGADFAGLDGRAAVRAKIQAALGLGDIDRELIHFFHHSDFGQPAERVEL